MITTTGKLIYKILFTKVNVGGGGGGEGGGGVN